MSAHDGPETQSIQARMAAAGVASVSALHDLHGQTVTFGVYRWRDRHGEPQEAPGGPATIFYAIGDTFSARMTNGREPVGSIAGIVTAPDGSLSYEFPEGA